MRSPLGSSPIPKSECGLAAGALDQASDPTPLSTLSWLPLVILVFLAGLVIDIAIPDLEFIPGEPCERSLCVGMDPDFSCLSSVILPPPPPIGRRWRSFSRRLRELFSLG
jgi:hypothetical protein